ncbi:uncharacterized protein LOC144867111 [Branchiostoma floridae x Branchiostoma japonicum]
MKICRRLFMGWGGSRSYPRGRWKPAGRHPTPLLSIRVVPAGVSAMATGLAIRKKSKERLHTRTKATQRTRLQTARTRVKQAAAVLSVASSAPTAAASPPALPY